MIEVNNVSFEIDGKKILKDINLKIPEGKIYGIIGPNGVGKTTLLRCLTGIYETTNGEVLKMILFGTTGILVLLIVDSMFSNAIMGIICMISILPGHFSSWYIDYLQCWIIFLGGMMTACFRK